MRQSRPVVKKVKRRPSTAKRSRSKFFAAAPGGMKVLQPATPSYRTFQASKKSINKTLSKRTKSKKKRKKPSSAQ